jgi:radical SAM superfamily enzyme YgiQ (UPF0313 family)
VKKSGLTFAPEAGSDRLRKAMGKDIDIERLSRACLDSFKQGWRRVKLYFMIGLPGETDDDVRMIADLVTAISALRKEIDGKWADVTASINAFIPKPHTAFQREPMDAIESLERKRLLIRDAVKSRFIQLDFHSFRMGFLEAVFSRGDRRQAAAVYNAWLAGARYDGWEESFDLGRWLAAFEKALLDPAFYVTRAREAGEILPWGFIDAGAPFDKAL